MDTDNPQKSQDKQLTLMFYTEDDEKSYSNTFAFYDSIPNLFVWSKTRTSASSLPPVARDFRYKGRNIKAVLTPARLVDSSSEGTPTSEDRYPGPREQAVLEALVFLASRGRAEYVQDKEENSLPGLRFAIYELTKVLKTAKHSMSYHQVKESIEILQGARIKLTDPSNEYTVVFSHISFAIMDAKTKRFCVQFNPILEQDLRKNHYRPYDYAMLAPCRKSLAVWLGKLLSRLYNWASPSDPFRIDLERILEESPMGEYDRLSHAHQEVVRALKELKKEKVIFHFKDEPEYSGVGRQRLVNVRYTLLASHTLMKRMKHFNKIVKERGLLIPSKNLSHAQ